MITLRKVQKILPNVTVITGRNEVLAKVIFLHMSVILFTGGEGFSLPDPPDGEPPLDGGTPPPPWRTPPDGGTPPGWRTPRMENPPDGEPPPPKQTPAYGL